MKAVAEFFEMVVFFGFPLFILAVTLLSIFK
jgi:hypothetical protein